MRTILTISGISKDEYRPKLAQAVEIAATNGGEIICAALLGTSDVTFRTLKVTIDHPDTKEFDVRDAFIKAFNAVFSAP